MFLCGFFFQAEDGIRDLVRSRGLGDVYKRQKQYCTPASVDSIVSSKGQEDHVSMAANAATKAYHILQNLKSLTVSYTHLTLPTSDLV